MDYEMIVGRLREHSSELQRLGVLHLRLFGSAARGEMREGSDVDLLADFDPAVPLTLVTLGRLQHDLSVMLGEPVDLSASAWMHEAVRAQAMSEAVLAF